MVNYSFNSPYAPFLNVESVCLDAFVVDHHDLQSNFFQRRKEFLRERENCLSVNLMEMKQNTAYKVGKLSGKYGSFWIDLGFSNAKQDLNDENCKFSRDNTLKAARSLFLSVPDHLKSGNLAVDKNSGKIGRGYLPLGSESGANGIFESKEGFAFGYKWENENTQNKPSNPMEEHNKWPPSLDTDSYESPYNSDSNNILFLSQSRQLLEDETVNLMNDIGNLLLRAYSLDLCYDESSLPDKWSGSESWNLTRIFRYFSSCSNQENQQVAPGTASIADKLGSSPHTDWGLLTVILACDEPGLQLLQTATHDKENSPKSVEQEEYITVLPRFHENKLFVNCGDFMSLMSNGKYISPKHRVLAPIAVKEKCVERTSIVHFFYPRYDVKLPPLDQIPPELQEKYSVFSDQRETIQKNIDTKSDDAEASFTSFGDMIASKWTQVAR